MRRTDPDSLAADLCLFGLADALIGSTIEKLRHSWTYRQERRIRAVVGIRNKKFHGPFEVRYPDGALWITGAYWEGNRSGEWCVYGPDGSALVRPPAAE